MQATTKRRLRFILLPLALLATLVLAVEVLLYLLFPPGYATGDPLDIQLVGVYTGSSTDLHDASGKVVGDTPGTADWPERMAEVEEGFDGYFAFLLPDAPKDIIFCNRQALFADAPGGRCLHLPDRVNLRRWFQPIPLVKRWRWRVPVVQTDYAVSWWQGPRGPASLTFTGPLTPGSTVSADNGVSGTLTISSYFDVENKWGAWCWLSGNAPMIVHEALAYDLEGKRRLVRYRLSGGGPNSGLALFAVPGLLPQEISAITFSETPRKKVFHNVTVAYDRLPSANAPDYLDKLSERLGVPKPGDGQDFNGVMREPRDALKVVDLIRGKHILRACRGLEPIATETWYAALPQGDRDRLGNALSAWVSADDPRIRAAGARVGMKADFRGFANAAIDLLTASDDEARDEVARGIIENASKLSDDDVLRLTAAALDKSSPERKKLPILEDIASSDAGAVPGALSRLAGDPRPWLWWRALRDERCPESMGSLDALPAELRARRLIASGFDPAIACDPATASDARTLLAKLITPEFERQDGVAFAAVFDLMVAQCGREAATRVIWSFLTSAKDYTRAGDALGIMVKHINLWNGVDIAGLGSDVKVKLPHANLYGWREIILDVVHWRDTGEIRPEIPPGYRVRKGDVRVILMKDGQPETAGIGLWIAPDSQAVVGGVHTIEVGSALLAYSIVPSYGPYSGIINGPPPPSRHDLWYEFEREGYRWPAWGNVYFETSGSGLFLLPQTADRLTGWKIVVEHADLPESILSGTKVFSDWWAVYGPATGAPADR